MEYSNWKNKFEEELQQAESARKKANEGMARVCARRAAGILIGEFYSRNGYPIETRSAHKRLSTLQQSSLINNEVKNVIGHFLIHVKVDHQLPLNVDLIEEARWLEDHLLNNQEKKMTNEYIIFDNLNDLIQPVPNESIISRTLFNDNQKKVVLFGFAVDQELSEHTASVPAIIHILHGSVHITLGDEKFRGQAGTWIHLPANIPHSIRAETPSLVLLSLIK